MCSAAASPEGTCAVFLFLRSDAVFEAPAVVVGFGDLTVMGETIKQCGGQLGIPCLASVCMQTLRGAKDGWPFTEDEIGGDSGLYPG
jgi:hypothetical protein